MKLCNILTEITVYRTLELYPEVNTGGKEFVYTLGSIGNGCG